MNENAKLERIRKSCKVGKTVSTVLCIIAIVGCVLALAAGITVMCMGKSFDQIVERAGGEGEISVTLGSGGFLGRFKLVDIDLDDLGLNDPGKLESDIPAIQKAIDDHPYSMLVSVYLFTAAFSTAVIAVILKLVSSVFGLIMKENTPFTDKVTRRVLIAMIVTSAGLFFTAGAAIGALGGIITWAVYTIMDYGKTLQIQSDETL